MSARNYWPGRARLSLPETAPAQIETIVREYETRGTLDRAAAALGCSCRTLNRAIADFPALARAIEAARNRMGLIPQ